MRCESERFDKRLLKTCLKIWWCCFLTILLVIPIFDGTIQKNLAIIGQITWLMVLKNLVVIMTIVIVFIKLAKTHPIFKWSWLSLFKDRANKAEEHGTNINLLPADIKYFGLVFVLLLATNLPSMAMAEEKFFRAGTNGWLDGLTTSLLFGIAHCLAGIPIGAGLAITVAGLWFTRQYFLGGVYLSALHHTTYNLILLSLIFLSLTIQHIARLTKQKLQ